MNPLWNYILAIAGIIIFFLLLKDLDDYLFKKEKEAEKNEREGKV